MPTITPLSPALEEAIVASVEQGIPPLQACAANGVSAESLRRWRLVAEGAEFWPGSQSPVSPESRAIIVAFVQRLSRAEASCFRVLTNNLYANATTRNERTGWYDTQAADKLLSKHSTFRQDWYEHRQVNVNQSGQVVHELRLAQALDDQSLDQAYQALDALPPPP